MESHVSTERCIKRATVTHSSRLFHTSTHEIRLTGANTICLMSIVRSSSKSSTPGGGGAFECRWYWLWAQWILRTAGSSRRMRPGGRDTSSGRRIHRVFRRSSRDCFFPLSRPTRCSSRTSFAIVPAVRLFDYCLESQWIRCFKLPARENRRNFR